MMMLAAVTELSQNTSDTPLERESFEVWKESNFQSLGPMTFIILRGRLHSQEHGDPHE